jgi:hypothetical protein
MKRKSKEKSLASWPMILETWLPALLSIPATAQQTEIGWPRIVQSNSEQIQIYQPQVDIPWSC